MQKKVCTPLALHPGFDQFWLKMLNQDLFAPLSPNELLLTASILPFLPFPPDPLFPFPLAFPLLSVAPSSA